MDEWRERTDASGKLAFDQPTVAFYVNAERDPPELDSVQIGIILQNKANFLLNYEVKKIDSQIMGRVGAEKIYHNKGGEITPNTSSTFRDSLISIHSKVPHGSVIGRMDFKIAYWRTPKRKYFLERTLRITLYFDDDQKQARLDWMYE